MDAVSVSENKVQRRPPRVGLSLSFQDCALTAFSCDQSATLRMRLTQIILQPSYSRIADWPVTFSLSFPACQHFNLAFALTPALLHITPGMEMDAL